jgi:hypothetical protein
MADRLPPKLVKVCRGQQGSHVIGHALLQLHPLVCHHANHLCQLLFLPFPLTSTSSLQVVVSFQLIDGLLYFYQFNC